MQTGKYYNEFIIMEQKKKKMEKVCDFDDVKKRV